jgi:hypothetical protein
VMIGMTADLLCSIPTSLAAGIGHTGSILT